METEKFLWIHLKVQNLPHTLNTYDVVLTYKLNSHNDSECNSINFNMFL